jgi:hypothetical protein
MGRDFFFTKCSTLVKAKMRTLVDLYFDYNLPVKELGKLTWDYAESLMEQLRSSGCEPLAPATKEATAAHRNQARQVSNPTNKAKRQEARAPVTKQRDTGTPSSGKTFCILSNCILETLYTKTFCHTGTVKTNFYTLEPSQIDTQKTNNRTLPLAGTWENARSHLEGKPSLIKQSCITYPTLHSC